MLGRDCDKKLNIHNIWYLIVAIVLYDVSPMMLWRFVRCLMLRIFSLDMQAPTVINGKKVVESGVKGK